MKTATAILPSYLILDPLIQSWLLEDVGRGDRTTQSLVSAEAQLGQAQWLIKESGIVAGLPIAARVFQLLNPQVSFTSLVTEGQWCEQGQTIVQLEGPLDALLTGERVALNLAMRLSGIATMTRKYVDLIEDLPTQLVDTRKTTPGLRLLEKYASQVGGAANHRMGLDDAMMIKDNHIAAAGSITTAVSKVRNYAPYPLSIEVETETLEQVREAIAAKVDIIMLDNMSQDAMKQSVELIRSSNNVIKIEASGNITLDTLRNIASTGVDYISTSAPITKSSWLDVSMRLK
jgi:nicotinate-nucleotide pyrophosphorylase (carboxylating)